LQNSKMNCPYCYINCTDIDKYMFHLKYIHKKDIFTCYMDNCLRSFHRRQLQKTYFISWVRYIFQKTCWYCFNYIYNTSAHFRFQFRYEILSWDRVLLS